MLINISHCLFDNFIYYYINMLTKSCKGLSDNKDLLYNEIYSNIRFFLFHVIIWGFAGVVFLYLNITNTTISNRVSFGIYAAIAIYMIAFVYTKFLKKTQFIEKEYEKFQTFSESEKKRLAKRGLFLCIIPMCAIPGIVLVILYILQETLWR